MIVKNQNNTISFSLFSQFPELVCSMSTRRLGDLNIGRLPIENANKLLSLQNVPLNQFVGMKQVHGAAIARVDKESNKTLIENVDCLVTSMSNQYLGVKTADCVPLFFYDPIKKIVAVVHAGWKGTLDQIAVNVIQKLENLGSVNSNIFVAIGPHIGGCCYAVLPSRAELFLDTLVDPRIVFQSNGEWFLDLGYANKKQLLENGILPEHIDASIACTSCQNDFYFSYRKEGKTDFYGEMLGIIGIKKE